VSGCPSRGDELSVASDKSLIVGDELSVASNKSLIAGDKLSRSRKPEMAISLPVMIRI
jgi:hypothetical protein